MLQPCGAPAPMPPAPCTPAIATHPHSMGSVMMPPSHAVAPLPPPPCSPHATLLQQQPCSPGVPLLRQCSGAGHCLHGGPLPQAPLLQDVRPVAGNTSALSVQWHGADSLAAGFSVELREGGAKCSERFMRSASGFAGTLELCIGGLNSGLSYMACVYAVSQCGCESAASSCSKWVTLPGEITSGQVAEVKDMKITEMKESLEPSVGDKIELLDDLKQHPPPEVTGHENETVLLD